MCLCVKLLPIHFLLTSGWCPVKVKLRATPSFFHAKGLDRPENRQPLRRSNRPSYYKHNHAYYHAAVILVLSCSKAYICLIKVPLSVSLPALSLSLFKLPLSIFFSHLVQINTCSGGWSDDPACKAALPVTASGNMMVIGSPPQR